MFDEATAIALRDKAASLARRYKGFTVRSLVIRTDLEFKQVEPAPTVELIQLKPEELIKGAQQAGATYEVKGISKKFTRTELEQEAIEFVIDGQTAEGSSASLSTDNPVTGIFCNLVQGSLVEGDLCWELKLIQRIGEERLYDDLRF